MTGVPLATDRPVERARAGAPALASAAVGFSTALVLLGLTLAIWSSPLYFDGALDRAGSPAALGLSPAEAHALSASVVAELLVGPGTFAQTVRGADGEPARFFGPREASHLHDVSLLVRLLALAVVAGVAVLAAGLGREGGNRWYWRAVARGAVGLAAGIAVVGVLFVVAFQLAFTLFHVVFFPGGNWAFDPRESRMVQLYPTLFWEEVTVVYFGLVVVLAVAVWGFARRRAARSEAT